MSSDLEFPFGADIGARTEDDVEAFLLGFADVLGDVVLPGEVIDAGARLVKVPEDVGSDGIQAHGAGLAEAVTPVGTRHAGIVHLAGDDLVGVAIELELAVGDGEGVADGSGRLRYRVLSRDNESRENQSNRKKSSVHSTNEFSATG